uniref:PUM-HD domain-containing protein n=1 Tax=Caenorhabditis japonica TaxID=281687 RepID=A0A8R1I0Z9_CAEJA
MVKLDDKKKKSKGKKKVKNVLEKKAKGLKLNKVDRKRIVRIEEKAALKTKVDTAVKAELERLKKSSSTSVFDNDGTRDSLCSESSFGSQPAPKKKSKRVSFSGKLEHTKTFTKGVHDLEIQPSQASPGRGILRSPGAKKLKKVVKVKTQLQEVDEEDKQENEAPPKKKTKISSEKTVVAEPADENDEQENENDSLVKVPQLKRKRTIQVTKSVKEQLLNMPRKERKIFLKELKLKRKPEGERAQKCKMLWEKIRMGKTPKADKDAAVHELYGLVKGHASKLIYSHDTSRVIECLVATEREGIINNLFNELTPEIVRMSKNVYSKFFVKKMLKNGTKEQRDLIINAFRGHASTLLRIKHAAEVLEYAYNDFANAHQRFNIITEFYGKEFILFREENIRSLAEILEEKPEKRTVIMKHLDEIIEAVNGKETLRLSILHKLMLDFFENCDEEKKNNLLESLKDKIPEFIHTPDGAKLAIKLIWYAPVKERKLIVKNFKDLSVKAAMEHYGHRVLLSLFDTIDDTVLVNKFIVSELSNDMKKLVEDEWGEKVIHYLVHPRDGRGIDKREIEFLAEGDSNQHSKKTAKDRYEQLYGGITENLYPYLAANFEELVFEANKSKFVAACLETTSKYDLFDRKVPSEARKSCNQAIVEIAKKDFVPMDQDGFHIIEHQSGNFVLMAIMRCDAELPEDERLSVALADGLSKQQLGSWITCNRGCHVLLKMLQVGGPTVVEKLKASINRKTLDGYNSQGARLLKLELDGKKTPKK